ncbi:MAG: hypothetical protein KBC38_02215 [Candidatus Pacebacteria bacterium]|nr:hypothetical protein [Candidatus Paceibacterota bacterium]MBP9840661.1 hypothetical protein [Candidatus Paceibacterota bacterium]
MSTSTPNPLQLFADSGIAPLLFYLAAFIFSIYSLIIAYHWLRYSQRSRITVPVLIAYGAGAALFLGFAASGLV